MSNSDNTTPRTYLIPRRIPQRWELFPGWGAPELKVLAQGAGVSVILGGLALVLGLPLALTMLLGLVPVAGVGFAVKPLATGQDSLWTLASYFWHYRTHPQRYLYDWHREDV